jgi:hypothetical protein
MTILDYWKLADAHPDRTRILIACEESGRVRDAFNDYSPSNFAVSCDTEPTATGREPHIQTDVLAILRWPWDLVIAHPPCTYLCNSGVCWLVQNHHGIRTADNDRMTAMMLGAAFFNKFRRLRHVPCVAIENPIPHGYARKIIGRYDQIIQPFQFGHPERKATCLWLKGLPKLIPTRVVKLPDNPAARNRLHWLSPGPERAKLRSRTFKGIARAMAKQWSQPAFDAAAARRRRECIN